MSVGINGDGVCVYCKHRSGSPFFHVLLLTSFFDVPGTADDDDDDGVDDDEDGDDDVDDEGDGFDDDEAAIFLFSRAFIRRSSFSRTGFISRFISAISSGERT